MNMMLRLRKNSRIPRCDRQFSDTLIRKYCIAFSFLSQLRLKESCDINGRFGRFFQHLPVITLLSHVLYILIVFYGSLPTFLLYENTRNMHLDKFSLACNQHLSALIVPITLGDLHVFVVDAFASEEVPISAFLLFLSYPDGTQGFETVVAFERMCRRYN